MTSRQPLVACPVLVVTVISGVDDPDGDAAEARQPGPVAAAAQDRKLRGAVPAADPDQEVRPGSRDLRGQEPGAEVPVGEQDHSRVQAAEQARGAGGLAFGYRAEHGVDDGAGAAADQDQQPQHRVAGGAVRAAALLGVDGQVRLAVGNGHDRAVDRDRQQSPPPRPARGRAAQQEEQLAQRSRAEPPPGLGHRGRGRDRHGQPAQSRGHAVPDLGVAQLGEQAPRQQQVHHDPGRQDPHPPLDPARFLQHRVDHLERHLLRQLAQVTRREPASGHRHGTGNDRLIHGGAPGDEAVFGGQTSLTGVPLPPHQPTHLDSQATRLTNRPWG